MTLFDIFRQQPRPSAADDPWYFAGLESSFPDLATLPSGPLSDGIVCPSGGAQDDDSELVSLPPCKIVQIDVAEPSVLTPTEAIDREALDKQVMVFRYRGKFHAVDHQCPHNSFPLSRGRVGDIEDFGVVLSAELTCPKHGWAFDLFTGQSDRGSYQLRIWEVQLRESADEAKNTEIWVRKKIKQRQG